MQTLERPSKEQSSGWSGASVRLGFRPVVCLAWVGGVFLAIEAFSISKWIVSGQATPTPAGPSDMPTAMLIALRFWEIGGVIGALLCAYLYLYRPWRREGHLTTSGAFLLAAFTCTWQDPLLNYSNTWFVYNARLVNLGSWTSSVPGWMSPKGHLLPEPLLATGTSYVWAAFTWMLIASWVLRRLKARRPQTTLWQLVVASLGVVVVLDTIIEPIWMLSGYYAYPGAIRSLTVFAGHYYQYPIYVAWPAALWLGSWALIYYLRDDRGQSLAERGLETLKVSPRRVSWVRFLAVTGALQACFFFGYNVPMQWFGMHSDPWPEDILKRSYFMNGMCGEGTDYACPGPNVPIPRRGSQHVNPAGQLVGGETPR